MGPDKYCKLSNNNNEKQIKNEIVGTSFDVRKRPGGGKPGETWRRAQASATAGRRERSIQRSH